MKVATTAASKKDKIAADPTSRTASPDRVKIPAAIMVPTPIARAEVNPKSRPNSVCILLLLISAEFSTCLFLI